MDSSPAVRGRPRGRGRATPARTPETPISTDLVSYYCIWRNAIRIACERNAIKAPAGKSRELMNGSEPRRPALRESCLRSRVPFFRRRQARIQLLPMVMAPFARLRDASLQKEHPVDHRIEARTGDTRKETSSCAFPHQQRRRKLPKRGILPRSWGTQRGRMGVAMKPNRYLIRWPKRC